MRAGFGIGEDQLTYVFVAMNPRLKGIVPLLHAVKMMLDRGQDLVLMLVGRMGYAEQDLAAKLGVRQAVRFVGPTDHAHETYCAADVTVLPSFYDPASRVVIESLALGVPAISTRFNGSSDYLTAPDGTLRGRVIADPADVKSLAQAMMELADPAERARCAAAAAGLADTLSIEHHVDAIAQLLHRHRRA